MKKILTALFLILSICSMGQTWQDKIASKFYSRIDSSKKLDCCDKVNSALNLEYDFFTYEMPYNSVSEVFDTHYNTFMDSSMIETIVDDLVKGYNKIPKKIRSKFKKSCYNIETKTYVSQKLTSDLVFGDGKIHFNFSFQSDKPYKRCWFKKLFGIL